MPLESCMILLDNSEFMRNGDYVPSRMESQHDAANFLVGAKTQSNPESTVGVIAMCSSTGVGADLLVSPTDDMGKILGALHGVPIRGMGNSVDITVSIQVASLALKHRRNKNGAQRIVVFVGSPLEHIDSRAMSKTGRMLKKNNVAVDIIAMGELEENEGKLKELVDAANGGNDASERSCHLVTIPSGVLPSDVLVSSPIVNGGGGGGGGAGVGAGDMDLGGGAGGGASGAGFADFGGVDPNMDPELAMALRVSMEEERARQERVTAASNTAEEETKEEGAAEGASSAMEVDEGISANAVEEKPAVASEEEPEVSDEDALLQQALAMSMNEANDAAASSGENQKPAAITASDAGVEVAHGDTMDMEDEDAAMQLALQMSMQPDSEPQEEASTEEQGQFQDPQFVNQLLGSLPGVDPNDPAIQNALRNINKSQEKKAEDGKEDKK